jgi:hypothetical protein
MPLDPPPPVPCVLLDPAAPLVTVAAPPKPPAPDAALVVVRLPEPPAPGPTVLGTPVVTGTGGAASKDSSRGLSMPRAQASGARIDTNAMRARISDERLPSMGPRQVHDAPPVRK